VEDTYSQKLVWFKQNEKPEALLVVADNPPLLKIIVAWTTTPVSRADNLTLLRDDSESAAWEWLWENTRYPAGELIEKLGASVSEAGLESKMKTLIGNRILYPDGTVNSFVQRYLREQVLKLFGGKPKRPGGKS